MNEQTVWVPMSPGMRRRILQDGVKMMLVQVHFESGAAAPLHQHPHEQISYIVSGHVRFTLDGKDVELRSGQSLHIPSNAMHGAVALEESMVLDSFSPPREDFRST